MSALHGIGHAIGALSHRDDAATARRLRDLVDHFLARRAAPDWVREYALLAREGEVQ